MNLSTHSKNDLRTSLKVLLATSVGGCLEMYDFVIYIFFAPTIASLFFPKTNAFTSMLATFSIFAIGYLIRPIGGIIFGYIGDKTGRKNCLLISLILMGIVTVAIGCLPSYQQINIAAPLLLTFFRLLQGITVGADLPGGITFVAEHANPNHRGFICAIVFLGVNVGLLFASIVAAVVTSLCTHAQLLSWGWRIGFWLSAILIVIGFYLRRELPESDIFLEALEKRELEKNPFISLFTIANLPALVIGIVFVGFHAIVILQNFTLLPEFLNQHTQLSMGTALFLDTISLLIFSLLLPLMGFVSDRLGRRTILLASSILWILCAYPLYLLLLAPSLVSQVIALLIIDILSALLIGTTPILLSELFKTSQRYSGVAFTYNIGFSIIGGLTPITMLFLSRALGNPALASLNIIVIAFIGFLLALLGKRFIRSLFNA